MYVPMCIKHTMKSEFTRIHMVPCVQIVNFNSCSMILNKEIEDHILEVSKRGNIVSRYYALWKEEQGYCSSSISGGGT